jgi:cytochrome c553
MMKDINHLIRAGGLALLVIVGFTIVRFLALPESWGIYGHYRADAVAEEMAYEPVYQGADSCKECHAKRYKKWDSGKHRVVNCENCHGPGKEPATKPKTKCKKDITINRTNDLCIRCHLKLPARPHDFPDIPHPQIDVEKHMKGKGKISCFKCHNPHHPDLKKKEPARPPKKVVSKIGRKVYRDKCLVCHGARGDGKTETAEFLDPKPPDFSSPSYKSTFDQIVEFIRKGKGQVMPAYREELSEEEIEEVAKYIEGFRR